MVSILTLTTDFVRRLRSFGPKPASSEEIVEQVKNCYDGNPIRDYRMVEVEEMDFLNLDEEPH
jgi:hypothetical protein